LVTFDNICSNLHDFWLGLSNKTMAHNGAHFDIQLLSSELKNIYNLARNLLYSKFQGIYSSKRPGEEFIFKTNTSEQDARGLCLPHHKHTRRDHQQEHQDAECRMHKARKATARRSRHDGVAFSMTCTPASAG